MGPVLLVRREIKVRQVLRVLWGLVGRLVSRAGQALPVPQVIQESQVNEALLAQLVKQGQKAQRERRVILAKQVLRVVRAKPGRPAQRGMKVKLDPQGRVVRVD